MQTMTFSARAYSEYKRTVAIHPPETGGLLIGRPDDPFFVTDFRFCPPTRNEDGTYNNSLHHFGIDADYVNWTIDNEWGPNGHYVLGFLHSHPRGVTQLSGGDMGGVAGDIPLLTACLETPEWKAAGVNQLLAPITTFQADGSDQLHGWVLRRGSRRPEQIDIVVADAPKTEAPAFPMPEAVLPAPENSDADLIDALVLRRRAILDKPHLTFGDRMLARRLYGQVVDQAFADPVRQESKSSFLKFRKPAKVEDMRNGQ